MSSRQRAKWFWSKYEPEMLDGGVPVIKPGAYLWYIGERGCLNDRKLGPHPVVLLGYVIDWQNPWSPLKYAICAVLTSSDSDEFGSNKKLVEPPQNLRENLTCEQRTEQVAYFSFEGELRFKRLIIQCQKAPFYKLTRRPEATFRIIPVEFLKPLFDTRGLRANQISIQDFNKYRLTPDSWEKFLKDELRFQDRNPRIVRKHNHQFEFRTQDQRHRRMAHLRRIAHPRGRTVAKELHRLQQNRLSKLALSSNEF